MSYTQNFNLKVKECFNKANDTYDSNSLLQQAIGNELITKLKVFKPTAKKIIDLGCGTGISTEKLANIYTPYSHFYAIDLAEKLLTQAKDRLHGYNIQITETDFTTFNFSHSFDVVFSNMALQWSVNLNSTLKNTYAHLSDQGVLAFSIPAIGTFPELKLISKLQLYEEASISHLLNLNNFKVLHISSYNKTLKFSSVFSALRSIKLVGANCNHTTDNKASLSHLLRSRRTLSQPFNLTYNISFFIAKKEVCFL
jgi:malonyl-CoA O-methyltransferase